MSSIYVYTCACAHTHAHAHNSFINKVHFNSFYTFEILDFNLTLYEVLTFKYLPYVSITPFSSYCYLPLSFSSLSKRGFWNAVVSFDFSWDTLIYLTLTRGAGVEVWVRVAPVDLGIWTHSHQEVALSLRKTRRCGSVLLGVGFEVS